MPTGSKGLLRKQKVQMAGVVLALGAALGGCASRPDERPLKWKEVVVPSGQTARQTILLNNDGDDDWALRWSFYEDVGAHSEGVSEFPANTEKMKRIDSEYGNGDGRISIKEWGDQEGPAEIAMPSTGSTVPNWTLVEVPHDKTVREVVLTNKGDHLKDDYALRSSFYENIGGGYGEMELSYPVTTAGEKALDRDGDGRVNIEEWAGQEGPVKVLVPLNSAAKTPPWRPAGQ